VQAYPVLKFNCICLPARVRDFGGDEFATPSKSITMSLSAEAEKRKERLLALKKRKRGQTDDEKSITENDDTPVTKDSTELTKPYIPYCNP